MHCSSVLRQEQRPELHPVLQLQDTSFIMSSGAGGFFPSDAELVVFMSNPAMILYSVELQVHVAILLPDNLLGGCATQERLTLGEVDLIQQIFHKMEHTERH